MHIGYSYKYENFQDSEAILDKGEKVEGARILDFRSEKFMGS